MNSGKKNLKDDLGASFAEIFGGDKHLCGTVCEGCQVHELAICASLDEAMLHELSSITSDKLLAANDVLVEEGALKKYVYTLRTGMLRLVTVLPDGRRQVTGFLMPGDFLGLIDDEYYTQTVEAVTASSLCCFRRDMLDKVMAQYPVMRDKLLEMTRKSLARARKTQLLLGRLTPLEKVANFLLISSRRAGENGLSENPVHLLMNRSDIADHLGLTVETVSRSFSKLKAQGLIRLVESNLVYIIDKPTLCDVAGARDVL